MFGRTQSRRSVVLALVGLLSSGMVVGAQARAGAAPQPTFAVGSATLVEGDSGTRVLSFPVTLSDPASAQVSINFTVGGGTATVGSDYKVKKPGTLVFKPAVRTGLTVVRKFVTVTVIGDTTDTLDETFDVTLSNPTGGAALGNDAGTGVIVNDDAGSGVRVSAGDAMIHEGDTGLTRAANVVVTLSQAPTVATVTVGYTVTGNTATATADFKTKRPATLAFKVGQVSRTIAVVVNPDTELENDETVDVTLTSVNDPSATITRPTGTLTIIDDDTVAVAATTVAIDSNPNPSRDTQAVQLNALVGVVFPGTGTPSGTVDFFEGPTLLGSAPLIAGSATLSVGPFTAGSHDLTATYGGSASYSQSTSPTYVQVSRSPIGAVAVAGGERTSCAVLENGAVKCWGLGAGGQLGQGSNASVGEFPGQMGDNLPPINLGTGRTATAVAPGAGHTCALLDNGAVKCWGFGASGQLGQGNAASLGDGPGEMGDALPAINLGVGRSATSIAVGYAFSCAVLDNGTAKCWGSNSGQLGQGNTTNLGDGPGEMGDSLPAIALGTGRTATAITAGQFHACALLDNGTVKCWGFEFGGRLGQGTNTSRGDGPGEMGDNLPAIDLGTGRTATAVSAGGSHTCALLDDATVKCWGGGGTGALGQGDTAHLGDGPGEMGDNLPAIDLGTGRTATSVSAGISHTCALLDDASLRCWGEDSVGQLGLGTTTRFGDGPGEMGDNLAVVNVGAGRTAVKVSAASGIHSCALLDDATVKCWGSGAYGELGYGDTGTRGDEPNEMGDNLAAVDLGTAP